jgi:hypothetical protein
MEPLWARHGSKGALFFAPNDPGPPKRIRRRQGRAPMLRGDAGYALLLVFCVAIWAGIILLGTS